MNFFAEAEEAAEAHHQRTPFERVDVVRFAFEPQLRSDVDAKDFHLQGNKSTGRFLGCEWMALGQFGL
jgi:hypothetical protein